MAHFLCCEVVTRTRGLKKRYFSGLSVKRLTEIFEEENNGAEVRYV